MAGEKLNKVLVVEDNESLLMALEYDIQQAGYQVFTARNGFEALQKARQEAPDIIISDLAMPEMDGIQLCNRLRQSREFMDVPFIFLSAYGEPKDRVKGLKSGADDYIVKPFNIEELIARMEIHRQKRRQKTSNDHLSGDLREIQLTDILQIFEHTQKQGFLQIKNQRKRGAIAFKDGMVIDAQWGKLKGEDALVEIFLLQKGVFKYIPKKIVSKSKPQRISHIMLRMLRLVDEKNALEGFIPDPTTGLNLLQSPKDPDHIAVAVVKALQQGSTDCNDLKKRIGVSLTRINVAVGQLIKDKCVAAAPKAKKVERPGKPQKILFFFADRTLAGMTVKKISSHFRKTQNDQSEGGFGELLELKISETFVHMFTVHAKKELSFALKPLLEAADAAVFLICAESESKHVDELRAKADSKMPFFVISPRRLELAGVEIHALLNDDQLCSFFADIVDKISLRQKGKRP